MWNLLESLKLGRRIFRRQGIIKVVLKEIIIKGLT